jgi:hypothetical protein
MDSLTTGMTKTKGDSDAYRRRRIFTTAGRGDASMPHVWWILVKQVSHELIYLSLGQTCTKLIVYQIRMTYH